MTKRDLRIKCGFSVGIIARESGVAPATIYRWEAKNDCRPQIDKVYLVATTLARLSRGRTFELSVDEYMKP